MGLCAVCTSVHTLHKPLRSMLRSAEKHPDPSQNVLACSGLTPLLHPVAVDSRMGRGSIPPKHLAQELTLVISGPSMWAAGDDGDRSVVRVSPGL